MFPHDLEMFAKSIERCAEFVSLRCGDLKSKSTGALSQHITRQFKKSPPGLGVEFRGTSENPKEELRSTPAAELVRRRIRMRNFASTLVFPAAALIIYKTSDMLNGKHSWEELPDIAMGRAKAESVSEVNCHKASKGLAKDVKLFDSPESKAVIEIANPTYCLPQIPRNCHARSTPIISQTSIDSVQGNTQENDGGIYYAFSMVLIWRNSSAGRGSLSNSRSRREAIGPHRESSFRVRLHVAIIL